MEHVVVTAVARSAAWYGPLRGWLEQRARELRDHPGIQRVRVVEQKSPRLGWRLELHVTPDNRSEAAINELLTDLELLKASPELSRGNGPGMGVDTHIGD